MLQYYVRISPPVGIEVCDAGSTTRCSDDAVDARARITARRLMYEGPLVSRIAMPIDVEIVTPAVRKLGYALLIE
jgi:hypothetical protein